MKSVAAGVVITGLIAVAGYTAMVVLVAASKGEGHGPVFWTSIAVLVLVVAGAIWLAKRVHAHTFATLSERS